jgi:hypothetical protein
MARRKAKAEMGLLVIVLIVGAPIYAAAKLVESVGWLIPAAAVLAVIALSLWYRHDKKQKRLAYLHAKYHNEELVQKIFNGYLWQGQTEEQLRDAIGEPQAVDRKILKTKTKETWKYQHQGANRFGLRITVEDGYVVGWDKKA